MTSHSEPLTSDPIATPKTDAAALQAQFFPFSAEVVPVRFARAQERAITELVTLLRDLVDIEGPQPGDVMWAIEVEEAIARHGAKP